MEKKNPYKFTLGFDKTKPSHVRATEILNSVKDKADLIASALVSYIDDVRQEEGAVLSNEALQVLMQEMVKQEVAKAMHLHSIKPEEPNRNSNSVMAVQQESLETITPEVAKSVRDGLHNYSYQLGNKKRNRNKNTRRNKQESLNIIKNKEGISMEMKQKECGIVCKENGTEQIGKITEEEWRLLKQYRNLCEENKLTINILIQRLLAHEKGRE